MGPPWRGKLAKLTIRTTSTPKPATSQDTPTSSRIHSILKPLVRALDDTTKQVSMVCSDLPATHPSRPYLQHIQDVATAQHEYFSNFQQDGIDMSAAYEDGFVYSSASESGATVDLIMLEEQVDRAVTFVDNVCNDRLSTIHEVLWYSPDYVTGGRELDVMPGLLQDVCGGVQEELFRILNAQDSIGPRVR